MRDLARARSSPGRTTSTPTCRRATRSASSTCRWRARGSFGGIGITRAHLEEDAAKLTHTGGSGRIHGSGASLVDFNRGGTPLVEIVTEPDIRSAAQAREFAQLLRATLRQLGVSDVNMEEGSLRVDGNISLRPAGSDTLGVKTELKNMNSFRFLERGIEAELERQRGLLDAGEAVEQETLHFDPDDGSLTPLRSKEYSHDYRYFPEPDLVPVAPTEADDRRRPRGAARASRRPPRPLRRARSASPRRPRRRSRSRRQWGDVLRARAGGSERRRRLADRDRQLGHRRPRRGPAPRRDEDDPLASKATPEAVARSRPWSRRRRSRTASGKQVLAKLIAEGGDPAAIVESEGLAQISDTGELESIVEAAIEAEPEAAEAVRGGNPKAAGRIMGRVMKETQGRADGGEVNRLIGEKLGAPAD